MTDNVILTTGIEQYTPEQKAQTLPASLGFSIIVAVGLFIIGSIYWGGKKEKEKPEKGHWEEKKNKDGTYTKNRVKD